MKKRRILTFITSFICFISILGTVACNNGNGSGSETRIDDETVSERTHIEYWMADPGGVSISIYRDMINNFNEIQDEVYVDYSVRGVTGGATAYDERLNIALAAGDAPDVIMVSGFISDAVRGGYVADITDLIENDPEFSLDIYYPHKVAQAAFEGRMYALPYNTDYAGIMVYNRNMFRQAGLDPTNPPRTIAELDEMAEMLTIEDGEGYSQMGFIPWAWLMRNPLSIVAPFGGTWADEQGNATPMHPGNIAALEWMQGYVEKYGYEKVRNSMGRLGVTLGGEFHRSAVAMYYEYNGGVLDLVRQETGFEWDVAPFPTLDGDETIDPGWGLGWQMSVTEQSEEKEAAFEFLKYLCGPGAMEIIVGNFDLTITLSSIPELNERFAEDMPRQMQTMINDIFPNIRPVNAVFERRNAYEELQQEAIEKILSGEADPRAALEDVQRRYNALLSGDE